MKICVLGTVFRNLIYLFKVAIEALEKGVKYVQNQQ